MFSKKVDKTSQNLSIFRPLWHGWLGIRWEIEMLLLYARAIQFGSVRDRRNGLRLHYWLDDCWFISFTLHSVHLHLLDAKNRFLVIMSRTGIRWKSFAASFGKSIPSGTGTPFKFANENIDFASHVLHSIPNWLIWCQVMLSIKSSKAT